MRLNESLRIDGDVVALVPYTLQHVAAYNSWMQEEALLQATASERLTLEEEVSNCRSWHQDETKATFIVLNAAGEPIGDCNLFLHHEGEPLAAEIEVMIAVCSQRRSGAASEALRLLQAWSASALGLRCFVAKVGYDNAASLALFAKLGYRQTSTSEVFREHTLRLAVAENEVQPAIARLRTSTIVLACSWTDE
jgi:RimJ/RimL family protein N-acetyltransferase